MKRQRTRLRSRRNRSVRSAGKCGYERETISHVLSCCEDHLWTTIKERHDRVLFLVVREVAGALGVRVPKHLRQAGGRAKTEVIESRDVKITVDQGIPTDRRVEHTRPDLKVTIKSKREIVLFEVAVAWEPLVQEREKEKKRKYKDLAADLAKQHEGYRVRVVPVVVGVLGQVVNLRRNLKTAGIFSAISIDKLVESIKREAL